MTDQEKAKAYDEALKWMRELYPGLHGATKEDAEHYFPELRESEDERIRKALIQEFKKKAAKGFEWVEYGIPNNAVLAWLEKQKEPDYLEKFIRLPHLNSDYEVVDDWAYTPSLAHCDGNWGVCWVHCEDGDTLHECIGDTPAEAIDKAVEWFTSLEKPIRAKEVGAIISSRDKEETACGYLERCLTPDMRKVWYEACDELKKACFQEAEKQKEQKPVILDYRLRDTWEYLDEFIRKFGRIPKDCDEISACIDYVIKRIPVQKPAEWSEEDENKIESIKGLITTGRFADTNTIRTIWKLLDSIHPRPSWKPSEEHLSALLAVFNDPDNIGSATCQLALTDLYEQLKSL